MSLIYFIFLFHIFFPFIQFLSYINTPLSFEQFRKFDQRNQFIYLTSLSNNKDISYSWHYLVLAYTQNRAAAMLQASEHSVAHRMGELIYNKMGFDGLTICTPEFGFGCYHGFSDQALKTGLSGLPLIVSACKKLGPPGSGKFESCVHGIGHGVASYYLVSDLPNSLKTCETLSAGQLSCEDGVFMEFYIDASPDFYTLKDPLYPCDVIDKKYTYECGKYQPSVMEKMHMSKKNIASACMASSDVNFQSGCFDALAFSAAYESGGNAQYIINQCSQMLAVPRFHSECLKKAAEELVFLKANKLL